MLYDRPKEGLGDEKHPSFGWDLKSSEVWSQGKMGLEKDLDDPGFLIHSELSDLIDRFNALFC